MSAIYLRDLERGTLFLTVKRLTRCGAFHSCGVTFVDSEVGSWGIASSPETRHGRGWAIFPDPIKHSYTVDPKLAGWEKENADPMGRRTLNTEATRLENYGVQGDTQVPLLAVLKTWRKCRQAWLDLCGKDSPYSLSCALKNLLFMDTVLMQCYNVGEQEASAITDEDAACRFPTGKFTGVPKPVPLPAEPVVFSDTGATSAEVNNFLLWMWNTKEYHDKDFTREDVRLRLVRAYEKEFKESPRLTPQNYGEVATIHAAHLAERRAEAARYAAGDK